MLKDLNYACIGFFLVVIRAISNSAVKDLNVNSLEVSPRDHYYDYYSVNN